MEQSNTASRHPLKSVGGGNLLKADRATATDTLYRTLDELGYQYFGGCEMGAHMII